MKRSVSQLLRDKSKQLMRIEGELNDILFQLRDRLCDTRNGATEAFNIAIEKLVGARSFTEQARKAVEHDF